MRHGKAIVASDSEVDGLPADAQSRVGVPHPVGRRRGTALPRRGQDARAALVPAAGGSVPLLVAPGPADPRRPTTSTAALTEIEAGLPGCRPREPDAARHAHHRHDRLRRHPPRRGRPGTRRWRRGPPHAGDTVVQNGTRHAWRNHGDKVLPHRRVPHRRPPRAGSAVATAASGRRPGSPAAGSTDLGRRGRCVPDPCSASGEPVASGSHAGCGVRRVVPCGELPGSPAIPRSARRRPVDGRRRGSSRGSSRRGQRQSRRHRSGIARRPSPLVPGSPAVPASRLRDPLRPWSNVSRRWRRSRRCRPARAAAGS